ncbi:unnamed protein product [Ixodes pacificus]
MFNFLHVGRHMRRLGRLEQWFTLWSFIFHTSSGPIVSVKIKIAKQREYQRGLGEPDACKQLWVATFVQDWHDCVKGKERKLSDLQLREVSLPPEKRLQCRPERGKKIVRIHDHVHQAVDADADHHLALRTEGESDPAVPHHDAVMDDVERRHLRVLLAEDEKHGVHELGHPNVKVPPATSQKRHGLLGHLEVDARAQPAVVALKVGVAEEEDHEGEVEDDHDHVVQADDGRELVGLAVPHPLWSLVLDEIHVEAQDHVDGNRVAGVEPSYGPGVPGTG